MVTESHLDMLTRRWTGWASFSAMVLAVDDPHYRPSLVGPRSRSKVAQEEREALTALADAYDAAQALRGDSRRAFR